MQQYRARAGRPNKRSIDVEQSETGGFAVSINNNKQIKTEMENENKLQ